MKLVMDFRKFYGVIGGVERFVIQITKFMSKKGHRVLLLSRRKHSQELTEIFSDDPNIEIIPLPVDSESISLSNAWIDSVTSQNIARKEGADIIHFPYNWAFPFRKKVPSVLTVHDVIPLTSREAMGFFTNHFLYKPGIRFACRLNNVITTVSEFSKSEIVQKTGIPAEVIRVIPNGLREPAAPNRELETYLYEKFGLSNGFILCVGGIHERKNIVRLIHAFSNLTQHYGYSGKLLVTGSTSGHPYVEKMKRRCDEIVRETKMDERVTFTGFITDEQLDTLFRRAGFLIYPSLYEGFGVPIIEAMQVGTPVITSNIGGTKEVAGDAAILVDPYNVDEITSQMARLIGDHDLRKELSIKGRGRAGLYSWSKTAEEYLNLYKSFGDTAAD